tara:strand:- start:3148 stop:3342 length:195 start_codon:yes stop_codon:yes gene_type:complete
MKEQTVTGTQLQSLRSENVITENEIAIIEGDLILAKNVLTQDRRIIGKTSEVLKESNERRVLKG